LIEVIWIFEAKQNFVSFVVNCFVDIVPVIVKVVNSLRMALIETSNTVVIAAYISSFVKQAHIVVVLSYLEKVDKSSVCIVNY